MKSGNHDHFCPQCKKRVRCEIITHCQRPDTVICTECFDWKRKLKHGEPAAKS